MVEGEPHDSTREQAGQKILNLSREEIIEHLLPKELIELFEGVENLDIHTKHEDGYLWETLALRVGEKTRGSKIFFLNIIFRSDKTRKVEIDYYDDKEEDWNNKDPFCPKKETSLIQGEGITQKIYKKLSLYLKKKSVKIIYGENNSDNVGFYIRKLKRFPEEALLDSFFVDNNLERNVDEGIEIYHTYDLLTESDKQKYVKPKYLENDEWRNDPKYDNPKKK